MLAASNAIDAVLNKVALAAGWLFLACIAVITFDVLSRKAGFQVPGLGSTRLQELEWHIHTAIFCFWLGVGYVSNAHVRIDVALMKASPRTHAWLELAGCILFALPYCFVAIYFSLDFTWTAFATGEGSPSANGLPLRWIPKSFISLGLVLLLAGVVSVLMRTVVYLFGPHRLREASAFAGFRGN
jgi:TRAP-type mannitol/chloroaromatic compound transport system permease small subunit